MKITNIRVYVGLITLWCSIFAAITANAVTLSLDSTTILQGESVTATTRVVFIGAGTPPAGSFRIDFGDGTAPTRFNDLTSTSHTFTVSHEYLAPGTYTVRATAQPALGFSAAPPLEASQTITVLEPNRRNWA